MVISLDLEITNQFWHQDLGLKSDNLQYNTLGRSSHRPSVWWSKYYFDRLKIKQWVPGLDLGHSKLFIFYFCKVIKKWKDFAKNFARNYEKIIICTWNIRCLVNETIVLSTQRPNYIEYCWILCILLACTYIDSFHEKKSDMLMCHLFFLIFFSLM